MILRTFRLGEITENFDSLRRPIREMDRISGEFPYYGASGVIDYVDDYIFNGKYLLIAEDGENLRSRSTPIAFMASGKFWANNHAHVVRGNELADTQFLSYLLSLTDISGYLTGSTQPKLTRSAMDAIKLEIPEMHVQKAIVEVLGALDHKISVNTQLAETCLALSHAEFERLMTAPSSPALLRDILRLEYGKSLPAAKRVSGDVDVFGSGGKVGTHNDALLPGPGVIVGRKGTAGSVHWAPKEYFPIDTTFYVVPQDPKFSLIFTYHLLKSLPLDQMNSDSAVPGLNREEALSTPVMIPSKSKIQEFSKLAELLFAVEQRAREESQVLASTRDALLPPLMSGKFRVKDAEKIVEDAV